MDKLQILQRCTIEGNIIKLPAIQLDRKSYQEVAKSLELIGGKWKGGKIAGFVFNENPTTLLKQIQNGDKKNIKNEYQFFATPPKLAAKMVAMAEIDQYDLVCEPSAGQGAIINAVHTATNNLVHYCELMELNRTFLSKIPNTTFLQDNFLLMNTPNLFHKIIANPPFSGNQDIQHIMHMWECIAPGGRIVTISSKHWEYSDNKKETAFRKFLTANNAFIEPLPKDTFKDSGTSIATNLIALNKP
jgi:hypothetical protein